MMYMAGVRPSATICEMMGDDGGSRCRADVEAYAQDKGLSFITGDEVIERWNKFMEAGGLL